MKKLDDDFTNDFVTLTDEQMEMENGGIIVGVALGAVGVYAAIQGMNVQADRNNYNMVRRMTGGGRKRGKRSMLSWF